MREAMSVSTEDLSALPWRKSSFSGGTADDDACVEVAPMPDGRVAMRNSKRPEAGTVFFTRAEMAAYLAGVKAGEFDNLA